MAAIPDHRPRASACCRASRPTRRRPATSACRRAGALSGSTAPPACTAAAPPTSSRSSRWCRPWPRRARRGLLARWPAPLGPTTCYINPAAATLAQIQAGQVGQYRAFYGRDIDIYGLSLAKNVGGHQRRRRAQLPPQHAAAKRAGAGAAGPAGQSGRPARWPLAPLDAQRRARRAWQHHARRVQPARQCPRRRFRLRYLERRAGVEPLAQRLAERRRLQGQRCLPRQPGQRRCASRKDFVGLGINFTPTWFQVLPERGPVDAAELGGRPVGHLGRDLRRQQEQRLATRIGIAADVQSRYNFALRYVGFYGDYSTTPPAR